MGACCGGPKDEEIQKAKSIQDIETILNQRRSNLEAEKRELKTYQRNPDKKPTLVNVDGLTPEAVEKRIPYLDKLGDTYREAIDMLRRNRQADVEDVKSFISEITAKHEVGYADENDLKEAKEELKKYFEDKEKERQENSIKEKEKREKDEQEKYEKEDEQRNKERKEQFEKEQKERKELFEREQQERKDKFEQLQKESQERKEKFQQLQKEQREKNERMERERQERGRGNQNPNPYYRKGM